MQSPKMLSATQLTRIPLAQSRIQVPRLGFAARSGPARQLALAVRAAKGFGKAKQSPRKPSSAGDATDGGRRNGKDGKRVQLKEGAVGPIPGQAQQLPGVPQQTEFLPQSPDLTAINDEDEDFLVRLQALKEQGAERKAAAAAAASGSNGAAADAVTPAIFDSSATAAGGGGAGEDIYANPPPLTKTLMEAAGGGGAASMISDPKLRDANIGPNQLGLAAGAIVFIAVFLIVAAGDYAPASRRYSGLRPAQSPPDPIEEKILKGKVALYEDQVKANPNNDDAIEALASAYTKLLQYDKAAAQFEKLTKRVPEDAEVWRLLGESSLLSQQPRKAVPAFERAVELRRQQQPQQPRVLPSGAAVLQPDLQLLTGLVDAYIANSDFSKAVDSLRGVREELRSLQQKQLLEQQQKQQEAPAVPAATAAASGEGSGGGGVVVGGKEAAAAAAGSAAAAADAAAMPAAVSSEAGAVTAAALPVLEAPSLTEPPVTEPASSPPPQAAAEAQPAPTSTPQPQPASNRRAPPARPLDPVGVELLTAKVYSSWRGHDQDALATYDELIKAFPEDYRGYLAKGVFLKEKGRKADAERMFLQARFFAPASKQQLVRAIADSSPALDLPDNN